MLVVVKRKSPMGIESTDGILYLAMHWSENPSRLLPRFDIKLTTCQLTCFGQLSDDQESGMTPSSAAPFRPLISEMIIRSQVMSGAFCITPYFHQMTTHSNKVFTFHCYDPSQGRYQVHHTPNPDLTPPSPAGTGVPREPLLQDGRNKSSLDPQTKRRPILPAPSTVSGGNPRAENLTSNAGQGELKFVHFDPPRPSN